MGMGYKRPLLVMLLLHCIVKAFAPKVTCPALALANELHAVLGHKWCLEHRVIISSNDEHVTFV